MLRKMYTKQVFDEQIFIERTLRCHLNVFVSFGKTFLETILEKTLFFS